MIWAGSNEDYQVQERYKLEYNYDDKDPESWLKTDFPARYYYEYLFPKLVAEEHKGAVYHPTSPWGDGKRTDDPTVGDIHQWNSKSSTPSQSILDILELHTHFCASRHGSAPSTMIITDWQSQFGMEQWRSISIVRSLAVALSVNSA